MAGVGRKLLRVKRACLVVPEIRQQLGLPAIHFSSSTRVAREFNAKGGIA
jgi:hypothetical protein